MLENCVTSDIAMGTSSSEKQLIINTGFNILIKDLWKISPIHQMLSFIIEAFLSVIILQTYVADKNE